MVTLGTCTPNAVGTIFEVIVLLHMNVLLLNKLDLCFAEFVAPKNNEVTFAPDEFLEHETLQEHHLARMPL